MGLFNRPYIKSELNYTIFMDNSINSPYFKSELNYTIFMDNSINSPYFKSELNYTIFKSDLKDLRIPLLKSMLIWNLSNL